MNDEAEDPAEMREALERIATITPAQGAAFKAALQPLVHAAFAPVRVRAPKVYVELIRQAGRGEVHLHIATILKVGQPAQVSVARVRDGVAEIVGTTTLDGGALVLSEAEISFN